MRPPARFQCHGNCRQIYGSTVCSVRWFEQQYAPRVETEDDPPPVKPGDIRLYAFLGGKVAECRVAKVHLSSIGPEPPRWRAIVFFTGAAGEWGMMVDAWKLEPIDRC